MICRPPRSTLTDTLFPYPTLFRPLLMRHVADHVAGLRPSIHFDTCTSAGAGACRSLWDDSRTIVDCVVAIGSPVRRLAFAGLMRARDVYLLAINSSAAPASPIPSKVAARR